MTMEQLAAQNEERAKRAVDALHAFQAGAGMEKRELMLQMKDKDVRAALRMQLQLLVGH